MNALAEPVTNLAASALDQFYDLCESAAATSSKNEKQAVIAEFTGYEKIEFYLTQALSPYVTFGVKKLPEPRETEAEGTISSDFKHDFIVRLLGQLATRQLTGNAAQDAIAAFLGVLNSTEREAFKRILLKDLRAGFTSSTVNKAIPGLIDVFKCQLAYSKMPDVETLSYPVRVEPKYDGVRVIAVKRDGGLNLFSRSGKTFDNFEEVERALTVMPDNFVFDGEVIATPAYEGEPASDGFARLMKRTKASRGKNIESAPKLQFRVFDGMPFEVWNAGKNSLPLAGRLVAIVNAVEEYSYSDLNGRIGYLTTSPGQTVDNADELREYYDSIVAEGMEGIIIKPLDGKYEFKRSKAWLKLKPMETADLKVTGYAVGQGKYEDMLGTFTVEGEHDGKQIKCDVGSGFSDVQRANYWNGKDNCIGKIMEVKYQDISKAEGADQYSLRFPVFMHFRAQDEDGNKV